MTITNEQAVVLTVGGVIVQAALYTITVLRAWKQRKAEKARFAAECEVRALRNQLALAEAELDDVRVDRDVAETLAVEMQHEVSELKGLVEVYEIQEKELKDRADAITRLIDDVRYTESTRAKTAEEAVEILRAENIKANEEIETLRAAVKQSSAWWTTPQVTQPYFQWKCSTCGISTPIGQHHLCCTGGVSGSYTVTTS